ncbi:DEAD/DEAH box helicase [Catenovulum sediminis]|uniref:DEAD/DEAH box helicase family protein n=1 Tax=Catenovulum sediminis TaxID=1740262 RepID=A0ABV1RJI8_9ALTE
MQLRQWQSECISKASKYYRNNRHFLCLATPAAGKTIMSASLAKKLLAEDKIDLIICFSPSVTTSENARVVFERILGSKFDGMLASIGCSLTYQAMLNLDNTFWKIFNSHRVFVVFDEIHHCSGGDFVKGNAWGRLILNNIKNHAKYTLAMSGTPWRSDSMPIALSEYTKSNGKISTHYQYGLARAIEDKVCRVPQITLIDNDKIVVTRQSVQNSYKSFNELFNQKVISYSELLHNQNALKYILGSSINKLSSIRTNNSRAAGLIVATSVAHALLIQRLMTKEFGETAEIVSYKTENSAQKIDRFRDSNDPWIISIGMISEGTDIPRLQVCCHLSRIKTELYFRQIIGRILRVTSHDSERAWLYTFAEPSLTNFAQRLNQDIPHYSVIMDEDSDVDKSKPDKPTDAVGVNKGTAASEKTKNITADVLLTPDGYKAHSTKEKIPSDLVRCDILGYFRQQVIQAFQSPF